MGSKLTKGTNRSNFFAHVYSIIQRSSFRFASHTHSRNNMRMDVGGGDAASERTHQPNTVQEKRSIDERRRTEDRCFRKADRNDHVVDYMGFRPRLCLP